MQILSTLYKINRFTCNINTEKEHGCIVAKFKWKGFQEMSSETIIRAHGLFVLWANLMLVMVSGHIDIWMLGGTPLDVHSPGCLMGDWARGRGVGDQRLRSWLPWLHSERTRLSFELRPSTASSLQSQLRSRNYALIFANIDQWL